MYGSSRKPDSKNSFRDHISDCNAAYSAMPYQMAYQVSTNPSADNGPNGNQSGRYDNTNGNGPWHGMGPSHQSNFNSSDMLFKNCTTNLFGRSFQESFDDFPKVCGKKTRRERDYTPSLVSDVSDSTNHTSSSYGPPPMSAYYRDGNSSATPPPPQAFRKDGSANLAPKIYLASQNASAQPSNNLGSAHYHEGSMGNFGGNAYYNANTAYDEGEIYMGQQKTPYSQAPTVKYSPSASRKGSLAK